MSSCLSLTLTLLPFLIVGQLGHRSFPRREAAQRLLAAMGPCARSCLEASTSHPDPETRRRVELLQRPAWVQANAEAKVQRLGKLPWIHEYAVGDTAFARYLLEGQTWTLPSKQGAPEWLEYREATRRWAVAQWLQKRPRRDILADLAIMRAEEKSWLAANPNE